MDRVLVPYEDYYFDNDGHWQIFPYNPSYIRVYRRVTGYYNYTGELESIFPTRLPGIPPTVPTIGGISVEILYMNGGKVPEKEYEDPASNIDIPTKEKEEEDIHTDPDATGHTDKWIPIEDLYPKDRDINEDADQYLIWKYPAGTQIKLYNCKYYSSPENVYAEPDVLSGTFYIYNYHIVEQRVRVTYMPEQINLPGRTAGWVNVSEIMLNIDSDTNFKVGDYVIALDNIKRYADGTGGNVVVKGQYMYVVAIATSLAWNFGDENQKPVQTDLSNTDYDFNELADPVPEDDDDHVYDYGTAEEPAEGEIDYDFGDEREGYTPEQWDIDFNNYNHDPNYVDKDDYDPNNLDWTIAYISDDEYEDWDTDMSPYDFLRMAYDDTYDSEVQTAGYVIGLAPKKNQTPVGWCSATMIKLANEGDELLSLYGN